VKTLLVSLIAVAASAAVWPAHVSEQDVPALLRATERVRALDEAALARMVPTQSGLLYIGCPNCQAGRQERQLDWSPERPGEIFCRFCKHRYPSVKYPMSKTLEVRNPRGETQRYPYWENASGYRYYFAAKRDDLVRDYLATQARSLALLYVATRNLDYARRSALILDRFAQVFPG
jgi:sarcosine oxidase delta subunit